MKRNLFKKYSQMSNLSIHSNQQTDHCGKNVRLVFAITSLSILASCGGGGSGGSSSNATLSQQTSGAATPTAISTKSGTVDLVEKLIVLDVQEKVPGKLDYKLAPIVCNDQQTKTNQKVTIKYADPAATVLSAETQVGASHYGQCRFNTQTPVEVRTEKAVGFDPAKVSIEIEEARQLATNPIRMVKVDLYYVGGRAGHEALLALNNTYPTAGQTVNLRAIVDGKQVAASFKVITPKGETLLDSKDFAIPPTAGSAGVFAAEFVVPTASFQVQITAKDGASNQLVWTTEVYYPQPSLLKVVFQNAIFTAPKTTRNGVVAGTASRSGNLTVQLHLPAGLQSDWVQKSITVTNGQTIELPFTLTAPEQLQVGKHRVFAQYKYEQDPDVLVRAPILINKTLN
jgi:hypothetical protein